jgi:hypothetical protein
MCVALARLYSPLTSITPARPWGMFALSDSQLGTIWNAADGLPAKKRGIFLERIVAWLQFRDGRFIDRDFEDAVRLALRGLIQESAA